jgi:ABC-type amino acid transport substrate-binding protein/ABC-type amino acid transport system permease subunit
VGVAYRLGLLLFLLILLAPGSAPAVTGETAAGGAAERATQIARSILDQAKAEAATGCAQPSDALVGILCKRRLVVGVRSFYPGFSVRDEKGGFSGFEPDIARRVAEFLGVDVEFVPVDPKTRIPMVADGRVDLVIATMGHSVQRSAEVRFIRPHYYISQTVIVGPKASPVSGWSDLSGRTICLPAGANSNIEFVENHVRVLTFDRPEQLLDALNFGDCLFISHDDTFFVERLADPAWAAQYAIKFRFAPLPWGMAVARTGAKQLATLLDDLSLAFHANGTFLDLARRNRIDLAYLESVRGKLNDDGCVTAEGTPDPACLTPPFDSANTADTSSIAPQVSWLESVLKSQLGLSLDLWLLKRESTLGLLIEGIGFSLALVIGSQISTMVFALGLGRLMISNVAPVRRAVAAVSAIGQVTPLPLLLFFVYVLAGGLVPYSPVVALLAAVFAIGVYNGSNAARAVDEAHRSLLRRDHGRAARAGDRSFGRTVSLASVQLVAFLINAAKGSPAAGMIGVPEFLNVVTDLTASSSDRMITHLVLLIFYVSLVLVVIRLLGSMRKRLVEMADAD